MSENDATATSTEETKTTEEDTSLVGGSKAEETGEEGKSEETSDAKAAAAAEEDKGTEEDGKSEPAAIAVEDLTFPEGFNRNDETLKVLTDTLESKDLSEQERAQALVDLYTTGMQEQADKLENDWQTERSKWVDATKELPKIGGDNLDASLGKIAKLIDEFGVTTDAQGVVSKELGEQFRQVLNDSGLGDHPTIVHFMVNVANAFSEGTPVSGEPSPASERTQAQKMYPNMN